jgi:hypothetical protein
MTYLRILPLALLGFCLGAFTSLGCSSRCGAPDVTTYTCTPAPADATGCQGGPPSDAAGKIRPDADKLFPVGCTAHRPFCLDAYPDSIADCHCQAIDTATPMWVCPV